MRVLGLVTYKNINNGQHKKEAMHTQPTILIKMREIEQALFKEKKPQLLTQQELKKLDNHNGYKFISLMREILTTNYSVWGIPCKEAVEDIKQEVGDWQVLEVFGSPGLLSYFLSLANVNVHCTDLYPGIHYMAGLDTVQTYYEIEQIGATDAVKKYPQAQYILMSWVPYLSSIAYPALEQMHTNQRLIYIGEPKGGCTADLATYQALEANFTKIKFLNWYNPPSIHDRCTIYERTTNPWIASDSTFFGVSTEHYEEEGVPNYLS